MNLITLLCFATFLSVNVALAESGLRQGYPNRYVVEEGDTLWDIAKRFLNNPWRWPLVWRENETIENPHLIFPGDLLVVTSDYRIKNVRLEPKIYRQPLNRAIPTISPEIIEPFLTSAIIVSPGELEDLGRVLSGVGDELVLGKHMKFYARGLANPAAKEYRLFKIGESLNDPETAELLGIEGIHLGDARMIRPGDDVSTLQVIRSNREIQPTDKLLPILSELPLPYYQPRSPNHHITGWIIHAPQGVREVGRYDVVIITGGSRDGLEEGHVLRALWHRGIREDPVTGEDYEVPEEESGLMMVFRVFEKLSYALIMESSRAISVGDRYESP